MTPTIDIALETFENVANKKGINLEKVDANWLSAIIGGTQIANFKTEKLFLHYVETALSNIPKKAILTP